MIREILAEEEGEEWPPGSPVLGRSPSRTRRPPTTKRPPWKGPPEEERSRSISPDYQTTTCLERRSRSPSPHPLDPTKTDYYGTTQLQQRSRSPSPLSAHSLPVQQRTGISLFGRKGKRRLPPTPIKPSTLRLPVHSVENINFPLVSHSPTIPEPNERSPNNINFPRLNASPTHTTKPAADPWNGHAPGIGHHLMAPQIAPPMPPTQHGGFSSLLAPLRAIGKQQKASSSGNLFGKPHGGRDLPMPPPFIPQQVAPILAPSPQLPYIHGAVPLHPLREEQPLAPPSFEVAAFAMMGPRGGSRMLPSPLPNGYKPAKTRKRDLQAPPLVPRRTRSRPLPGVLSSRSASAASGLIQTQIDSDEDDDDWC